MKFHSVINEVKVVKQDQLQSHLPNDTLIEQGIETLI